MKKNKCAHKKLSENYYPRAISLGANKYCPECNCHFKDNELKRIYIKCDCGCGYTECEKGE